MTEPNPDTWEDALTRRLRTLLRTLPLHRVESNKAYRSEVFELQDLRAIALRALDLTIERMGLGHEATFGELQEELRPLILLTHPELRHDEADAISETVILGLLNETGRRQAFSEPYLEVTKAAVNRRLLDFHLLRERERADGTTVLVATTEGINLYAGMLEYPVEDAQIAEEAVLQSQVRRGRIADAVRTAQRARLRSIEYERKLLDTLETTRRDIRQVDWVHHMLGFLDTARAHVSERIDVEREILKAVEHRIDAIQEESGSQLVTLREALHECITRHVGLHERLIQANGFYLDEQERQSFRPRLAEPLPNMESEVLRLAISMPAGALADLTDPLLALLNAPQVPVPVRLGQLVDRLLAPRRDENEAPFELTEAELERLSAGDRHFTADDHATVTELLEQAEYPTTLGSLLRDAEHKDVSAQARHLLVLRILGAYDPEVSEGDLHIEPNGGSLVDTLFRGNDLAIDRSMAGQGRG